MEMMVFLISIVICITGFVFLGKSKRNVDLGWYAFIFLAAAAAVAGIGFFYKGLKPFGIVFIAFGGLFLIIFLVWFIKHVKRKIKNRKEQELLIKAKNETEKELKKALEKDAYAFPGERYYDLCQQQQIYDLDNAFVIKKAYLIMDSILESEKIPAEYWERYHGRVKELYFEGKEKHDCKIKQKALEDRVPKQGELSESNKAIQEFHKKYSTYIGKEKSQRILEDRIKEQSIRIQKAQEDEAAAHKLGTTLASSYSTQKTHDWVLEGGIASGIAGGAVGAAVAINAIAENQKIEAQNTANRQEAAKLSSTMVDVASAINRDIEIKRGYRNTLSDQLNQLKTKVEIDNIPKELLIKSMDIKKRHVEPGNGYISFSFELDNRYIPDAPKEMHFAIDGSFDVELKCDDDIVIDRTVVTLPLYGVECGKTVKVEGVSPNYMEGSHSDYRFSVTPRSLWLVEI